MRWYTVKKQCEIVQDLLPLYVDGVLKAHTEEYVNEHLGECERCQLVKQELLQNHVWQSTQNHREPLPSTTGETEFITRIRSWKKRTSIAGIVLIVLVSVISWMIGKSFQDPQPVISPQSDIEQKTSLFVPNLKDII